MKVKEAEGAEDNTPSLKANQLATAFMIFASLGLAFIMPGSIIARATAMFMGLCAAAFLPMFAYGLFVKDPKKIAAELSLAVGAITWFLWTVFVHSAESQPLGICKWFFGVDTLMGQPWPVIDALVIALPASIITLLVVWWIAARKDRAPA